MPEPASRPADEQLRRRAKELVADWPPLTDEQRAELRRLLAPVRRPPKT